MKTWQKIAALVVIALGVMVIVTDGDDVAPPAAPPPAATVATVDAAAEYGAWVRGRVAGLAEPITASQALLQDLQENPALILDHDWKTRMGSSLDVLQMSSKLMRAKVAPPGAEDAKAALVTVTDALIEATDLIAPALDAVDAAGMTAGMAKVAEAGEQMSVLAAELDEIDPR